MTREEFEKLIAKHPALLPERPSWLDPHGLTVRPPVGAVGAKEQQSAPGRALEQNLSRRPEGSGRVEVLVTIVACRRQLLDRDNSAAGYKKLQDAIAESLCVDDGAGNIRFVYEQVKTEGAEGTIVRIEWI